MAEVGLLEKVYTGLDNRIRDQRAAVTDAKKHLAKLERLYKSEKTTVTYHVMITSLWEYDGEESVESRSKNLERAIKSAGRKHHQANNRTDWQVSWSVKVLFRNGDDKTQYELHPDVYRDLIPGGDLPTPIRLKNKTR